jgi:predicted transglutaminase-like cysteine proteinase
MRPDACAPQGSDEKRFQPTPERLSELDDVNRGINRAIAPATDVEIYGVSEYWTLPADNRGDCEDYALLKQKLLVARGWPLNALLLTVVRDEKGEGHAVLTVRTSQGDYILDNKADAVKLWNKSSYQFVMRQSYLDPRVWVSLDASEGAAPGAIAGVREGQ